MLLSTVGENSSFVMQEKETRRHQGTLDKLAEELGSLQSRAAETSVVTQSLYDPTTLFIKFSSRLPLVNSEDAT